MHGSSSVADLSGVRVRPPGVQILSILCSFWGNLAKSYVCAPTSGKSWIRHCSYMYFMLVQLKCSCITVSDNFCVKFHTEEACWTICSSNSGEKEIRPGVTVGTSSTTHLRGGGRALLWENLRAYW